MEIEAIKAQTWLTAPYTERQTLAAETLTALAAVPREEFVAAGDRARAWENIPLGIGFGQTISQPFIVALMTDLIAPHGDSVVLEIGTGSGYQTAVLARLAGRVYSVELIVPLAEQARTRLARLGYHNIEITTGDGYAGWPEHAPYDGILVTAAVPVVPDQLTRQLKPGGRMVIPVGLPGAHQELMLLTRLASSRIKRESLLTVAFSLLVRPDEEHDLQQD